MITRFLKLSEDFLQDSMFLLHWNLLMPIRKKDFLLYKSFSICFCWFFSTEACTWTFLPEEIPRRLQRILSIVLWRWSRLIGSASQQFFQAGLSRKLLYRWILKTVPMFWSLMIPCLKGTVLKKWNCLQKYMIMQNMLINLAFECLHWAGRTAALSSRLTVCFFLLKTRGTG